MCIYWKELDDERGDSVEFCRAVYRKCYCSGAVEQCDFLNYYNERKNEKKGGE
jgi:hypothetical protein